MNELEYNENPRLSKILATIGYFGLWIVPAIGPKSRNTRYHFGQALALFFINLIYLSIVGLFLFAIIRRANGNLPALIVGYVFISIFILLLIAYDVYNLIFQIKALWKEEEKALLFFRSSKGNNIKLQVLDYTLLTIWAIAVVFPFYYMILTSLKTSGAYASEVTPVLFTTRLTLENYISVFTGIFEVDLLKTLWNTLFVSVISTALMIIVCIFAAFAFARLKFKGRDVVFTIFLAMMMIPQELVIITNYNTAYEFGWLNSFTGIIVPSILSVFYIYLLRQNFMQVPDSMYYAAKVDRTSDFKYLWKILIPLSKPTIISIIILKLIEMWNSYVWPRSINDLKQYFVVSQAITSIAASGKGQSNVTAMMAAVVSVTLPLLIIFIIFRNQIMSGVSRTGTKG